VSEQSNGAASGGPDDVRTDFRGAFTGPQTLRDADRGPVHTRVVRIGEVSLPSGTVVVGDPLTGMSQLAFGQAPVSPALTPPSPVGPGPFPVDLCVARFTDNDDERVACARLRFGEDVASRWEHSGGGAGVDSGHAGFADGASVGRWDDEAFLDRLTERVDELSDVPTWNGWCGELDGTGLALFSSGWGDGLYGALWGWSEEDRLVELVLDFDVLTTPDVLEVELQVAALRRGPIRSEVLSAAGVSASVPWLALRKRVSLRWRDQSAYLRWKHPDGRFTKVLGDGLSNHGASYDVSSPHPDATLSIAIVQRWVPMPKLEPTDPR
jgi:hypothetical protein